MSNSLTRLLAIVLLTFVFVFTYFSIQEDSLTMDELAHLPAGYSYLSQMDMRINPEHPPLVKDFAGAPLMLLENINFPHTAKAWTTDVNGQWDFGNIFLFKSGNPAEIMIMLARIPMMLLLLLAGYFIFRLTRQLFGNNAGILALTVFSFSPTFLAHGRLVTTDVGAALGVVMATYYFLNFLKDTKLKTAIKAGIALGIAELLKFSPILLIPFFGLIAIAWIFLKSRKLRENIPGIFQKPSQKRDIYINFFKVLGKYTAYGLLIGLIALVLVYFVYLFHVWNYPIEKQKADTSFILASSGMKGLSNIVISMAGVPILRPFAQYFLGLFMIFQRASGGNTGYFLGEMSAAGWKTYFPYVYFMKETLTFHIFTLMALLYALYMAVKSLRTPIREWFKRTLDWAERYFSQLSALLFIVIYWVVSLRSNLNIGVRHLLPVFPFTIMLFSGLIILWMKQNKFKKAKLILIFALVVFQVFSVLRVYPYLLTYFNEAVGGPGQGYKYVTDSNLDWGQDLKRLNIWLTKNNIDKVYLDYFGGSDTKYYLGDKYISWQGDKNKKELPKGSYLAISATMLQQGRGTPAKGFEGKTGYYLWLNNYTPVTVIGNSIFVYRID